MELPEGVQNIMEIQVFSRKEPIQSMILDHERVGLCLALNTAVEAGTDSLMPAPRPGSSLWLGLGGILAARLTSPGLDNHSDPWAEELLRHHLFCKRREAVCCLGQTPARCSAPPAVPLSFSGPAGS